jgi:hypothetical protein
MRAIEGAERMAMRFTLLERTGLDGFRPVSAKGLRWRRSRPGVGVFGHRQAVSNLAPGGVYRARVDFRWYSEDGDVLDRARRRSRTCPDQRKLPNLRVRIVGVRHTQSSTSDRYAVRVSNTGRAPAEDSLVRLSVDGVAAGSVATPRLPARAARYLTLRGPECQSRSRRPDRRDERPGQHAPARLRGPRAALRRPRGYGPAPEAPIR